jgi:hypothetical protein
MVVKKDFFKALVCWFFVWYLGAHRIYITEKMHYVLWYWAASICTFGILPLVDLFLIKGMIEKKFEEDKMREELHRAEVKRLDKHLGIEE